MKATILVIDDDTYNLTIAKKLLCVSYNTICVTSGKQALSVLQRRIPDLILLDIVMPEMNGFDVIALLKKESSTADIPVIFLTADSDADTELKCLELGAEDFITKPFEPKIMLSRVSRSVELGQLRKNLREIIDDKTQKLENMQYEFTREIANIVEGRDENTGGHVQRTCNYVKMIAKQLRKEGKFTDILTESYINKLSNAASLHDIGKIGVSDVILNKPDRLTAAEFDDMKRHVLIGGEMIEKLLGNWDDYEYYRITKNIVCFHHEKWDGTGYMGGLCGEEIPLEARIMAVADVFDALISKRCYKEPVPIEKAFTIIKESSGSHFDPGVTKAFLNLRASL